MKSKIYIPIFTLCIVLAGTGFYLKGVMDGASGKRISLVNTVEAAGGVVRDPKGTAPDRYVYYPGTEPLAAARSAQAEAESSGDERRQKASLEDVQPQPLSGNWTNLRLTQPHSCINNMAKDS